MIAKASVHTQNRPMGLNLGFNENDYKLALQSQEILNRPVFVLDILNSLNITEHYWKCWTASEQYWKFWTDSENYWTFWTDSEHYWKFWTDSEHYWKFWANSEHDAIYYTEISKRKKSFN